FTLMQNWARQSPQFSEPRVELARLYEEAGDPERALKHLEDAIIQDPYNQRAFFALGKLRENAGDLAQAIADYNRGQQMGMPDMNVGQRIASLSQRIAGNRSAAGNPMNSAPLTPGLPQSPGGTFFAGPSTSTFRR
ncbi:MAG: tetratricopeptide repeat protein, partial [Planctomycetota bacterium]